MWLLHLIWVGSNSVATDDADDEGDVDDDVGADDDGNDDDGGENILLDKVSLIKSRAITRGTRRESDDDDDEIIKLFMQLLTSLFQLCKV